MKVINSFFAIYFFAINIALFTSGKLLSQSDYRPLVLESTEKIKSNDFLFNKVKRNQYFKENFKSAKSKINWKESVIGKYKNSSIKAYIIPIGVHATMQKGSSYIVCPFNGSRSNNATEDYIEKMLKNIIIIEFPKSNTSGNSKIDIELLDKSKRKVLTFKIQETNKRVDVKKHFPPAGTITSGEPVTKNCWTDCALTVDLPDWVDWGCGGGAGACITGNVVGCGVAAGCAGGVALGCGISCW